MTRIVVRFVAPGFHQWQNAPEHRAYLRDRHRHLFHVEVKLEVLHDDREVEFHDLLAYSQARFGYGEFGNNSCEHLAKNLIAELLLQYPGRVIVVSVFEDGEVGAEISYVPDQ